VLICGGGFAGWSLAAFLQRLGLEAILVEKRGAEEVRALWSGIALRTQGTGAEMMCDLSPRPSNLCPGR
jgi:2-polyprenyl-6-methoxyphenol hydroxylase-like FAD-dependent oxidoreductase